MKIRVELEVSDEFTKGCCYDCPFTYQQEYDDGDGYLEYESCCIFSCSFDECPLEIIREEDLTEYKKYDF